MKHLAKKILQKILGFNTYLFIFSIFTIFRLKYDKKEKDFFHLYQLIKGKGYILDIGANIGIMTTHLARKFPENKIISFEPIPENIKTLQKIIKIFKLKNVKVKKIALSNNNQKMQMIMPVKNKVKMQGLSHIIKNNDKKTKQTGICYTVETKKLDDIKFNEDNKIEAIKIDVENFEYQVLKGAEKLLRRDMPVIYCELWDNENRELCFKFLSNIGYSTKVFYKNKLEIFDKEKHNKQNFFFILDK